VVDSFDVVLATEQCNTLARCCSYTLADGGADGGTFDMAACVAKYTLFGFEGSNVPTAFKDAGAITLDQVKAADCINKIKSLTCNLPGTEYTAIRAACYGAYAGKFAVGQPCNGAAECQPGLYCNGLPLDGGAAGVCATLKPLGGPCGENPDHPTEYEEACSYRGGGGTGNYCLWTDPGGATLPSADWKCTAAGAPPAGCLLSTWCKDSVCDGVSLLCTSPEPYYTSACGLFVK
jgi:hypothetical protein